MTVLICTEDDYVQITDEGVGLLAEYGQPVNVECGCGRVVELRVCADDAPPAIDLCDVLLDDYLGRCGWTVDPVQCGGDVCPDCAVGGDA
jgi:hypothetical protein